MLGAGQTSADWDMFVSPSEFSPEFRGGGRFATTRWSVVLSAAHGEQAQARAALEALCRTYWYPLYAYVRRKGHTAHDTADLIQEFFAFLLEKDVLAAADPNRGRFRTFLLTVLQRFLSKERERAAAQKRGGRSRLISIDTATGEERYRLEPFHELTPERIYQRRWALTVLEQVLQRLAQQYAERGQGTLFERLRPFLAGSGPSYAELAAELHLSEGAVKVAVHRLRERYRNLLRDEVAQTVERPEDVQEELDFLLKALQGEAS